MHLLHEYDDFIRKNELRVNFRRAHDIYGNFVFIITPKRIPKIRILTEAILDWQPIWELHVK